MGRVHRHLCARVRCTGPFLALVLLALAGTARARTTIVPDDFATIQAAIDHVGESLLSDTILVRPGEYPEIIAVSWEPAIVGMDAELGQEPSVRIAGLRACYAGGVPTGFTSVFHGGQRYIGLRFTGPVLICNTNGPVDIGFLRCRFDGGVTWNDGGNYPDLTQISFGSCEFFGTTSVRAQYLYADGSIFHGPLSFNAENEAYVYGNRFENVAGRSITVYAVQAARILQNVIRGGADGIHAEVDDGDVHLEGNDVEGCSGDGIYAYARDRAHIGHNRVSNCRGIGIRSAGTSVTRGNRVLDCSGIGIHMRVEEGEQAVEGNVVGRCGGDGIVVDRDLYGDDLPSIVRSNTIFSCAGAGLRLHNLFAGSVAKNLASFNTGAGLVVRNDPWPNDRQPWTPLDLSCNDWFANGGGPTSGVATSTSDLAIDPVLCDGSNGDGSLRVDSPLLDGQACGLIGALGQGCEAPTVAFGFEMWPRVLTPSSRTRWVTAWLEPPVPFSVTAIDVATVRVNDVPVAQGSQPVVGDEDRDGIPDLQLRFDRAALERTLATGEQGTVALTGRIDGRLFAGTDEIRVLRHGGPRSSVPRGTPRVLSIQAPPTGPATGSLRVTFTLVDEYPARTCSTWRVAWSRLARWEGRAQASIPSNSARTDGSRRACTSCGSSRA